MVIDLFQMKGVTIDLTVRIAQVQAEITTSDLIKAAQEYNLATATGTISGVGMTELILGGGYGLLNGAYH